MSGSRIFTPVDGASPRSGGNVLIHLVTRTWRVIRAGATSIGCRIEQAKIAADHKQLRILCEQRHRRWD